MAEGDEPSVEIKGDGDTIEDVWVAGYPLGKIVESLQRRVSDINGAGDELAELRARVDQLEQDVATRATPDGGETMTKKAVAEQISMQEALRRADKGISGGQVDWPTVRDIADRQYSTDLNSGTVYAAWDDLVEKWTAFNDLAGEPGPHGKNRRLVVDTADVTPSLRKACGNQG